MGLQNLNCSIVIFNPSGSIESYMIDPKNQITPPAKCYKKFTPVRVDWGGGGGTTTLCISSHQEVEFIFTTLESGLGHVTCFGQWFISKNDANRGLQSAGALGLLSFAAGNPETTM